MTTYAASSHERAPGPAAAEDILDGLRQIIAAATTLTDRFQARIPGMEGAALTPFALHEIARAGRRGMPQVEVARILRMSPSSATRLIDALESNGVVRRQAHPNDRRVNQIVLTVVGKALVDDMLAEAARQAAPAGLDRQAVDDFRTRLSRFCAIVG
ncbi:MAG TPA: MarR family transcriptional regulator [Brevundimonas sp.]|jgi:DNA-binding MarR family transcriptional regulator|uniref:MarR family winged helix-turn-helix transcriptional regulator n=1 Tax=Brevundimonas sp. TaxID=1871086 RepID=UPI002DF3580A|nr:MarR family transcriptional regulator [Brevundimonas sp.]